MLLLQNKIHLSINKHQTGGKRKADNFRYDMKHLKCVGDVVFTGGEAAPARGSDPLVVTKQSVPVTPASSQLL